MLKYFVGLCLILTLAACGGGTEAVSTKYDNGAQKEVYSVKTIKEGDREFKVRHGAYQKFHPNGKLERDAVYADGRLWEVKAVYDSTGKTLETAPIAKGSGKLNTYYPDGSVASTQPYVNGMIEGRVQYFDAFGGEALSVEYLANEPVDQSVRSGDGGMASMLGDTAQKKFDSAAPVGFDPKASDLTMALLKQDNLNAAYQGASSQFKKEMTAANFETYINYMLKLYGKIKDFKRVGFQVQNVEGQGEMVVVGYQLSLGYLKAECALTMLREGNQYRLINIEIQTPDFTPIPEIRAMTEPIIKIFQSGDVDGFYNKLSARARQKFTKDNVNEMAAKIKDAGSLGKYDLAQHRVMFVDGMLMVEVVYEVSIGSNKAALTMMMTKYPQGFELEAFTFGN